MQRYLRQPKHKFWRICVASLLGSNAVAVVYFGSIFLPAFGVEPFFELWWNRKVKLFAENLADNEHIVAGVRGYFRELRGRLVATETRLLLGSRKRKKAPPWKKPTAGFCVPPCYPQNRKKPSKKFCLKCLEVEKTPFLSARGGKSLGLGPMLRLNRSLRILCRNNNSVTSRFHPRTAGDIMPIMSPDTRYEIWDNLIDFRLIGSLLRL